VAKATYSGQRQIKVAACMQLQKERRCNPSGTLWSEFIWRSATPGMSYAAAAADLRLKASDKMTK
jgi:hypothetical protein